MDALLRFESLCKPFGLSFSYALPSKFSCTNVHSSLLFCCFLIAADLKAPYYSFCLQQELLSKHWTQAKLPLLFLRRDKVKEAQLVKSGSGKLNPHFSSFCFTKHLSGSIFFSLIRSSSYWFCFCFLNRNRWPNEELKSCFWFYSYL